MVNNFTIYGERCSGTSYLEGIITKNFNAKITWDFGWKHFFGFEDLTTPRSTGYSIYCHSSESSGLVKFIV